MEVTKRKNFFLFLGDYPFVDCNSCVMSVSCEIVFLSYIKIFYCDYFIVLYR